MNDNRHIVVGIDFSHCSANALKEALRVAPSPRMVIALHVIDEWAFSKINWGTKVDKEELMRQGTEQLELWVAEQLDGRMVQCEVVVGKPFVELVEAFYRHDADLLVLGTHGLESAADRTGTVATKCARKAPVPVLLVRYHQERSFQNVAACLDFSEMNGEVVREAARIAKKFGGSLYFIHVIRPMDSMLVDLEALSHAIPPDGQPKWRENAEDEMKEFLLPFQDELDGLETKSFIVESVSSSKGITEFAKEHDVDLLVLASRGRTGLNWILMGTTAEKVIHETPCSTLVIKPDDFKPPRGV